MKSYNYDLIQLSPESDSDEDDMLTIEESVIKPTNMKTTETEDMVLQTFSFTHYDIVTLLGLSELQSDLLRHSGIDDSSFEISQLGTLLQLNKSQTKKLMNIIAMLNK